jgi:hypothetical protein
MAHRPDSLVIRNRVEDRTAVQKEMFINILENVHTVSVAAKLAGLSRDTVYRWRKEDEEFSAKWDNAIEFSTEMLETAAYHKIAAELSDKRAKLSMPTARLTEFMLSGMKPDKYKQRGTSVSVDNRQMAITIDWSSLPEEIVTQFNQNLITLQDVYEYIALQSERSKSTPASQD